MPKSKGIWSGAILALGELNPNELGGLGFELVRGPQRHALLFELGGRDLCEHSRFCSFTNVATSDIRFVNSAKFFCFAHLGLLSLCVSERLD